MDFFSNQLISYNIPTNSSSSYTNNLYNPTGNASWFDFFKAVPVATATASSFPVTTSQTQNNLWQSFLNLINFQNPAEAPNTNFSYDISALKTKWSKYNLSDAFYQKVVDISKKINCDPNALMATMKSESGLNSKAVNRYSKATGLIQFMPKVAQSLGTNSESLKAMSPEQQLTYVEKYLVQRKESAGIASNKAIDAGTLYSLVFLPAYANKNVLCQKGSAYYDANTGLDTNHDGLITKADLTAKVNSMMA